MKNLIKLFGIIALVAVIGFGIAACGGDDGTDQNNNNNTPDIASFSGTWNASEGRSIVFSGSTFNYIVNGTTTYSGTFSVSGSTITFNATGLGTAKGNFTLSGTTLTLSNHTWDSSVNGTYTKDGSSSGGGNVIDGTWNRTSGGYTYSILISGNNWTFSENSTGIFKGTWSSNVTPAAPSSGTIILTATHQNSSSGWISLPAQYESVKTNTATFTINTAGNQMIITNSASTNAEVWGKTEGTYTKSGGGSTNFDTSALDAVIQEAVSAKDGVEKASNASEVPTGKKWVTESEWNTFDSVYKTAAETRANPSSQAAVDTAKSNLQTALVAFNNAKKAGSSAAITLSGTITVKNNGQTVPYVMIQTHTEDWSWQEMVKIPSAAENTPWSIITKPFSSTTEILFDITGYNNDKYENALFSGITYNVTNKVYNTDVNNITINMDLNFITISGTLSLDYGKVIPSVRIDINKKGGINDRLGAVDLINVGSNTTWSTTIPAQTNDTDVIFNIVGFEGPIPYEYDQLFALWEKDFGVKVRNQNKTGIALNLITVSGTINVTYNGNRLPGVVVHIYKKVSGDDNEWLANTEILAPSANAPWSLIIPAFTDNTEIAVGVEGKNGDDQLFWWWYHWDNETKIFAKDKNVTIPLNPGNITGDNGTMTWTPITTTAFDYLYYTETRTANINAITYDNNKFVAVGGSGTRAYSSDGINWTAVNDNKFTSIQIGSTTYSQPSLNSIAYGNNKFVAGGNWGIIGYSSDGINWTVVTDSKFIDGDNRVTIRGIAYGNNKFVAVGDNGKMSYSPDGITWTAVEDSKLNRRIYGIAWGNNKFVAVAGGGQMTTSPDGINWTAVTNSSFGSLNINSIAWGNNKFVSGATMGSMAYSPNGENWTSVTDSPFGSVFFVHAITWGNNKFVAGGGLEGNVGIAYSPDGMNWTLVADSTFGTSTINGIAYGNNKFVAVGDNGKIAYSSGN